MSEFLLAKKFEEDNYFNSKLFLNINSYRTLKKDSCDSSQDHKEMLKGQEYSSSIQNCLSKDLLETIEHINSFKEQNDLIDLDSQTIDEWTTDTSLRTSSPANKYDSTITFSLTASSQKKKKKEKRLKKSFAERDGDWTCFYCKNLNFSFRKKCNRCKALKEKSDKEHDKYMENILSIINENEKRRNSGSSF